MEKLETILVKYIWIIILVLSIPAIWALLVPGFYGASDDLHVAWLFEMDRTLKLGQFPPRFVPDLSFQFGYPLFNFVFPLPFYLGEIFHLVGLNLVDSVKAVFLVTVPLSMYFMYKLIRQFAGVFLSLAAAVLYVYTPYRATDLYVRGAVGEIVGFVFLPLTCLAVIKVLRADKVYELRWVGIGALSIGALVLTHDITAYMFFPLIAVLSILFLVSHKNKKALLPLLVMGILGLLISLYFWYPAIADSKLMKYDTVFNFEDHFPTLVQLIKPYWGYGASVPGPYDGMSFFVGIFNWIGFLAGIPLLILWRKKFSSMEKIFVFWGYIVFLLAVFMMNYRSVSLWKILPELPYFQFPWRFLILTTFTSSIFFIALEKFKYSKQLGLILVILVITINAFQFRPQDFLGRTDAYYLDRYIPFYPSQFPGDDTTTYVPDVSQAYKQTQEEYLRLPLATQIRPDRLYPTFFANTPITIKIFNTSPFNMKTELGVSENTTVNYNKYSFPGWKVSIDGHILDSHAGQPLGQISFPITAGTHKVTVSFQETTLKLTLDLVSLLAFMVALIMLIPKRFFRFKSV